MRREAVAAVQAVTGEAEKATGIRPTAAVAAELTRSPPCVGTPCRVVASCVGGATCWVGGRAWLDPWSRTRRCSRAGRRGFGSGKSRAATSTSPPPRTGWTPPKFDKEFDKKARTHDRQLLSVEEIIVQPRGLQEIDRPLQHFALFALPFPRRGIATAK